MNENISDTFEEFQASRTMLTLKDDREKLESLFDEMCGVPLKDLEEDETLVGFYFYDGLFYISIYNDEDEPYHLFIERDEWWQKDLNDLEAKLWQWWQDNEEYFG